MGRGVDAISLSGWFDAREQARCARPTTQAPTSVLLRVRLKFATGDCRAAWDSSSRDVRMDRYGELWTYGVFVAHRGIWRCAPGNSATTRTPQSAACEGRTYQSARNGVACPAARARRYDISFAKNHALYSILPAELCKKNKSATARASSSTDVRRHFSSTAYIHTASPCAARRVAVGALR